MISHIHHVNFLVHDLECAIERYQILLGEGAFEVDELEQRAVKTARTKLGQTWLILVQPLDHESVPAKHLEKHGEGFFLLSLSTENLDQTRNNIESQLSNSFPNPERKGLQDWRVLDLELEKFFGVQLQLTQEN